MGWLIALMGGVLAGGSVAALWLRGRAAKAFRQGQDEGRLAAAALEGRLDALTGQLADARAREAAQGEACEEMRALLADAQQKLGAYGARAARVPELETRTGQLEAALGEARSHAASLQSQLAAQAAHHEEKLAMLASARAELSDQFRALAGEILEEKTQRFTEHNREQVGLLLGPLSERLGEFGRLVQDTYDKDSKERLTLENELKRLTAMNAQLGEDALALTRALTGGNNKAQGTWGEMVLEKVLEASGLTRDREYRVQVADTVDTGEGVRRYQPDVVIDLPEGKQLVVDAKVSLNAYVRYTAASDEAERARELAAHIAALRTHIRTLSEKRYQDLYQLKTLDFVFMFVPVEPAYLLAVQHDMSLFSEAFERRIMIVGPSTLLATLRTVESIWRYEHQNRNAQEIARQGGLLYDKFAGFAETLEKVGRQLDTARDSHAQAMRQLKDGRGNLMSRAENLRLMGVKASRQLPAHLLPDSAEPGGADED